MANIGKSAKLYQERRRLYNEGTRRGPGPQLYLDQNAVHHLKLEPPLPLPTLLHEKGAPDSARTQAWPFGDVHAP